MMPVAKVPYYCITHPQPSTARPGSSRRTISMRYRAKSPVSTTTAAQGAHTIVLATSLGPPQRSTNIPLPSRFRHAAGLAPARTAQPPEPGAPRQSDMQNDSRWKTRQVQALYKVYHVRTQRHTMQAVWHHRWCICLATIAFAAPAPAGARQSTTTAGPCTLELSKSRTPFIKSYTNYKCMRLVKTPCLGGVHRCAPGPGTSSPSSPGDHGRLPRHTAACLAS